MSPSNVCYIIIAVVVLVAIYMAYQYRKVKRMPEGNKKMSSLAEKIRTGSKVFTKAIYKRIVPLSFIIAVILTLFVEVGAGLTFLGGLAFTTISVIVGMSVATYTNVRTAATALKSVENNNKEEVACAKTVNTTITGSQICGLIVHASSLLGLAIVILSTGISPEATGHSLVNIIFHTTTAPIVPIVTRLTAYSLGWSIVAMFCRVPGGIFTKAADIGADLIGKVFMHFEEDDHRNPAVVCDFIGDNVNDIDGNQADLGESFTATPVTAIVTAVSMYGLLGKPELLAVTAIYPLIIALGGLISSLIGLFYASHVKESKNPAKQINASMYIAGGGALIASFVAAYFLFGAKGIIPAEFKLGWWSLILSTALGIVAGTVIGLIAQYFTDLNSKWCKNTALKAPQGSPICASYSQAGGWISCLFEILVVAICSWGACQIAGPYGQAIMALSMLSFVAQPISADAFGPISDNAGGIAESCELDEKVRTITDKNDAFGNSSAAVGKAFAICAAAAVILSQINGFMMAAGYTTLDLLNSSVMLGLLLGGGLIATFCGLLAKYTLDAADEMAKECIKQLSDEDIVAGRRDPDYKACVKIATENALRKMVIPVALAIGATLILGFVFGPSTLGGALAGVMTVGLPLAIYFSNAGGLADNAKKRFEAGLMKGFEKGTLAYERAHDAATVGDTIGDWMKDVVAVAIDIFMKIMGTIGIMLAPMMAAYYLFGFIG